MGQTSYISKLLNLILPFGRKRLLWVIILSVSQGVLQALSIFSILPFLSFVTNPQSVIETSAYQRLSPFIPIAVKDNLVLSAGLLVIILTLLSNIINILSDYTRQKYATHTAMLVGSTLLSIYAYQPYSFHLSNNSGELIKRIQGDVNRFLAGALMPFIELISKSINVIFILTLLLLINWQIILLSALFFSLLVGFVNIFFKKKLISGNLERKDMETDRYQSVFQLLTGIKSAIIHNAQEYFLVKFKKQWGVIAKHDTFLVVASNGPRYLIEAVAFSGIIFVVLYLNYQGRTLESLIPTLAIFVLAAYRILPSLQLINAQVNQMKSFKYTVDLLSVDFKDKKSINSIQKNSISGLTKELNFKDKIIISNLYYKYKGASVNSLSNINLEIHKGQRIGIVGTSGAGKSTLVDLMLGLLQPDTGGIYVDYVELNFGNISTWRKKIGYVPQDIFLIDDTVTNNIAFGIPLEQIDRSKIERAAKSAQIHDFITTMPDSYSTFCGDRGVKLSGGQRQRIVLARALYNEPEVLIFDEATSALDNATEKKLLASIDSLPKNLTILQIAHRLETIKNCDMVFVLKDGSLESSGSPKELSLSN